MQCQVQGVWGGGLSVSEVIEEWLFNHVVLSPTGTVAAKEGSVAVGVLRMTEAGH